MDVIDKLVQDSFDRTKAVSETIQNLKSIVNPPEHVEITKWIEKELTGYAPIQYDALPRARKGRGIVKANVPNRGWQKINMPKKDTEVFVRVPVTHPLSIIEKFLESGDDFMAFNPPAAHAAILQEAIRPKMDIAIFIKAADLTSVLTDTRQKLIESALTIKDSQRLQA